MTNSGERLMNDRLALLAEPQVDGAVVLQRGPQRQAGLDRVAGTDDRHVRQRPQQRDVLAGMMRRAQRRVGQAGADADDDDRHVVVADVDADLFQAHAS